VDQESLITRIARRLAGDGQLPGPRAETLRAWIELRLGVQIPDLLWVFLEARPTGRIGPLLGTFSIEESKGELPRAPESLWTVLERSSRQPSWIPAFDLGCGDILMADMCDPEGPLLLDCHLGTYRLETTLPQLLEQWLAGPVDARAWFIEGPPTGRVVRFGARVATLPPPVVGVRGVRVRAP
jgi:hypothetical protein